MATLTVWKFPTPDSADRAVTTLERLQKQAGTQAELIQTNLSADEEAQLRDVFAE